MGRTLDVLIDAARRRRARTLWLGRTYADAPDVDGVTLVHGGRTSSPATWSPARSSTAQGYDLVARPVAAAPPRAQAERPGPGPRKKPPALAHDPGRDAMSRHRESGRDRLPTATAAGEAAVLERPQHADRGPAGAGRRRLRADRLRAVRLALAAFVVAALSDALDGYFARLLEQDTPIGRQLDPLIDKVIVSGLLHLPCRDPRHGRAIPGWSRRSSSASC